MSSTGNPTKSTQRVDLVGQPVDAFVVTVVKYRASKTQSVKQ